MTNTYRITITGRNMMKPIPSIYIPAGNINVDVISFDITGDEWNDLQRIAVFVTEKKHIKILLDAENKAVIPHEITSKKGMFSIGLWAASLDEAGNIEFRFSTNLVTGFVGEGACGDDYAESEKRQASAYEKLIYQIKSAVENTAVSEEKARKYAEQAQFAEQKAKEYSDNTVKNAETVSANMQTAVEAAKSASASSEIASQSAASASASAAEAKGYSESAEENAKITTDNSQTAVDAATSATESEAQAAQSAADAKAEADRISEISENVSANAQSVSENTAIAVKASEKAAENALLAEEAAKDVTSKANKNYVANALKGSVSGEVISITDVSPIEHEMNVSVRSKNALDVYNIPTRTPNTKNCTINEVGVNENGENYIIMSTPESYAGNGSCSIDKTLKQLCPDFEAGDTVIASWNVTTELGGTVNNFIYLLEAKTSLTNGKAKILTEADLNSVVVFYGSASSEDIATLSCFQIEKDTTVTVYTPYVDVSSVGVSKTGKNIIPYPYYQTTDTIVKGITFTLNADRSITVSGTSTSQTTLLIWANTTLPFTQMVNNQGSDTSSVLVKNGYTFSPRLIYNADLNNLYLTIPKNVTVNETLYPFIYMGEDITATYEPYIEPRIYTPSEDGTAEGVTSLYPTTKLLTDTTGVVIEAEYNRDLNKAFAEIVQAIVSMGGNI